MTTNDQQLPTTNYQLIYWLFTGCFLIFLMVIIGGITRLTHSGLSITEWNILTGTIPPLTEQHWNELFDKYRQSPEFFKINYYFSIDDFKKIFWWEYIHRLLGRIIGIVFIVPFTYFLVKKKIPQQLLPKLIVIFLLGAFQGFLGWFMVKSGLSENPAVSHYRLTAHLITAFATFGYTFWVAMDLTNFQFPISNFQIAKIKIIAMLLFSFVLLQIIYGAFVAGLKAGYLYPTFPKMNGEWIASEVSISLGENGWIAFFENGATVQFIHRCLAFLILIFSVSLWIFARKKEIQFQIQMAVRVILLVVSLQIVLGIFTLLNSVPIHLAVAHQAGAFVLFSATLYLLQRILSEPTFSNKNP